MNSGIFKEKVSRKIKWFINLFQVWRCRKWASHSTVPAPYVYNGRQGKWVTSSSLEQQNVTTSIILLKLNLCVCVFVCVCVCVCVRARARSLTQSCLIQELQGLACLAPLSMGLSRQENWNGLPCPPPGDLPNPALIPGFWHPLHWQADSL